AKGKHQSLDIYECYDGDTDEQVKLKTAHLQQFHAGMEAYFAKDMTSARHYFEQVYQSNSADITAGGFLHRVHGYLMQGLPEGWNGVEIMQNK
ncbi:MAG: hypothetical protein ABIQ02_13585, partial [Saprospiraceae bacterium]